MQIARRAAAADHQFVSARLYFGRGRETGEGEDELAVENLYKARCRVIRERIERANFGRENQGDSESTGLQIR